MPTVLRKDGFQVIIWTDDHLPSHDHVFKAGGEVIFNLGDAQTNVSIRENYNMRRSDLRQALLLIMQNQIFLIERWREIHG